MPKKKTRKAAAKRLKKTSGGKVKYAKAGGGHLMGSKTRKRKRRLRAAGILDSVEEARVRELF
ncbi:MAG: 50S ribosomal protein L35 [Kiritimatiellia bacterium]